VPDQVGRYRILERLGSGGMDTVFKAQDPHLDRIVALKMPKFDGPSHQVAQRVQRFQRDARAAAQIWHPHVCPLYDVGEDQGRPFVVMAFVEGASLEQRLAAVRRFESVAEAVAIILQVLDGLAAVHARGILHRDLKPGNILLDPAGRPVLTDFGLARPEQEAEHLTSDGVVLGTPHYMAPEQASGQTERLGPWTDLYSLGVVFYRMLTGRLPFEGPPLAVLTRIIHEPIPPPSQLRPDLGPELETIVLKMLAKDPGQRYANARALAENLRQWGAHRSHRHMAASGCALPGGDASNPFLWSGRSSHAWVQVVPGAALPGRGHCFLPFGGDCARGGFYGAPGLPGAAPPDRVGGRILPTRA
jgi:serine/threonine protein kinase